MRISGLGNAAFRSFSAGLLAVGLLVSAPITARAQAEAGDGLAAQREAMQKLAFLAGRWSGPIAVVRGSGDPAHLTQSEDVQFKLDGLVLLIEGMSVDAEGKSQFDALATVAYDEASHTYRFRAYHGGHYLDTELAVTDRGFSWSYQAGPAHIVNTMHLTAKGEWAEVTEATVGSNPPQRSVDMLLERK